MQEDREPDLPSPALLLSLSGRLPAQTEEGTWAIGRSTADVPLARAWAEQISTSLLCETCRSMLWIQHIFKMNPGHGPHSSFYIAHFEAEDMA